MINVENLELLKYHLFFQKKLSIFLVKVSYCYSNCGNEFKKKFKEEESIKILKILGLITNIEEFQKMYNHD